MSEINVIGAACVDLLCTGLDKQRFFSGKFKLKEIKTSFGGDALNEAFVLKALGKDVRLIALLGADLYGRQIHDELNKKGIAFSIDNIHHDIDTGISLVFIEEGGERFFVGNEDGSFRLLDLEDIKIDEDCKIVSFASLFISKRMDLNKYEQLFTDIRKKGITICADTSTPKNDEYVIDCRFLKQIDYLFINESEAKALCRSDDLSDCERLLYDQGVRNVVIKCGKKGCIYRGKYYLPEKTTAAVDTTGAGDSFAAAFIAKLSEGGTIGECLRFANYCGGLCCRHLGATVWLKEYEDIYRNGEDNTLE